MAKTFVRTRWGDWTRPMIERFRAAYTEAVAAGKDEFVIDGQPAITQFAKYLLEYCDKEMPPEPDNKHKENG